MDIDTGRSGADAPSGLRPDGLSQSSLSQAEPLVPNAAQLIDQLSNFVDDPAYDIGMVRGVMRDARNFIAAWLAQETAKEQQMREFEKAGLLWRNAAPNAAPPTVWLGGTITFFPDGRMRLASAIEARRAETQSGSVADESAVPKADAQ
jgi:hypothetical protein